MAKNETQTAETKAETDGLTLQAGGWHWTGQGDPVVALKAQLRKVKEEQLPVQVSAAKGKHTLSVKFTGGEDALQALAIGLRNWLAAD